MGNWIQLSIKAPIKPLEKIASGISTVTTAIATAISIQKSILQIISALAIDFLNIEAIAIKTALKILEDTLEQYIITDAKLHMLVVPVRKRLPYNLYSDYAMPQEEDSWVIDDSIDDESKKQLQEALERVAHYDQGNPGFARTVIEAAYDRDDPNAPKYDNDDAVFGMVFLCGAQSMLGVYDLLRALQGVLGTALKGNSLIPTTMTRTPQDLKVKPIAVPSSSRVGAQLTWGNPPTFQTLAEYDGVRVRLDEIAIIRSTNDDVMNAKDWMAIFGGSQPEYMGTGTNEVDDALESADGQSTVIKIYRFDGVRNAYIDDDEDLEKGTAYYYAVAYKYALAEDLPQSELEYEAQKYHQISNVVKVLVEDTIPSTRGGIAPDWITHPSALDLIPDLKFFMALLQNQLNALGSFSFGANAALQSYIKFLAAELTRYQDFATEINAKVQKLASLLQLPAAGIYVTTISSSAGGTDAFLQEMTRRLTDESDTTAPPFFRNGFVSGIVLMLGAPNPAEFASTKALLELLFGPGSAQTPFEDALDSIDHLLDALEDKMFGNDMKEGTPETTVSSKTFDDAMNPVEASDPSANIPFDP